MTTTGSPSNLPRPPSNASIFSKLAITGKRCEVSNQSLDVILRVRPVRVARHLGSLPGIKVGVQISQRLCQFAFKLLDLLFNGDRILTLLN